MAAFLDTAGKFVKIRAANCVDRSEVCTVQYEQIHGARFLARPNRFIAHCLLPNGEQVTAHVKNTGRCAELLLPGAVVYLQYAPSTKRRTAYSLIAVEKGQMLVNLDSQAPNKLFREGVERGIITFDHPVTALRPEVRVGESRLDFALQFGEVRGYVEVKGVTLEEDGVAMFPDAPTLRGIRHVEELIALHRQGHPAAIALIVQMRGMRVFRPNPAQPAFGEALVRAKQEGVRILCYECAVTENSIEVCGPLAVEL